MTSREELADFNRAVSEWSNQFAPELRKVAYVIGSRMGWDHCEFQIAWSSLQRHYEKAHGETISANTLKKYARLWETQGGLKIVAGWRETNGPQLKKDDPGRRGKDGKRVGTRGGRRMSTDASTTFAVDFNTVVKAGRVPTGQRGRPVTEYWAEPWEFGKDGRQATQPGNCLTPQLPLNSPSVTPYSSFDSSENSAPNYPGCAGEVNKESVGNSQHRGGQAPHTPEEPGQASSVPGSMSPYFTWYLWRSKTTGRLAMFNAMLPGFNRKLVPSSAVEFALSDKDGAWFTDQEVTILGASTVEERAEFLLRSFGTDEELASLGVDRNPPEPVLQFGPVPAYSLPQDEIESLRARYAATYPADTSPEIVNSFFRKRVSDLREKRIQDEGSYRSRYRTPAEVLDGVRRVVEKAEARAAKAA